VRGSLLVAATVLAGLASPVAQAGTARVEGNRLVYSAPPAQVNGLSVMCDPANCRFSDTTAEGSQQAEAGPGCAVGSIHGEIDCPRQEAATMFIDLGDANDTLVGVDFFENFRLVETNIPVTALGGPGNDQLDGRQSSNVRLEGGDGDDRLDASGRDVALIGGPGADFVQAEGTTNPVIDGGGGNDKLRAGFGRGRVDGGSGNDVGVGGFGRDRVNGGSGHDRLLGGCDDDVVAGGSGNDVLGSNDEFDVRPYQIDIDCLLSNPIGNRETVRAGPGNDRAFISTNRFGLLDGGPGRDRLFGSEGSQRRVTIRARDGRRDSIKCGNRTRAIADRVDRVDPRRCRRRR
jgi:Ca2+-binding RTX toxin-like protein